MNDRIGDAGNVRGLLNSDEQVLEHIRDKSATQARAFASLAIMSQTWRNTTNLTYHAGSLEVKGTIDQIVRRFR